MLIGNLTLEQSQAAMLERKAQRQADARRKSARDAMRKRRRTLERRNVRHVQEWREEQRKKARAARHLEIVTEKAARDARRIAREEKKALNLRKHATHQAGFVAGWQATDQIVQTDDQLKALSYSRRFRTGYAEGHVQRQQADALLHQKPATTPEPSAVPIQLP